MQIDPTKTKTKIIEFNVQFNENHYTNFQNVNFCFLIKIKSTANSDNYITARVIALNHFFAYWIKAIDIKRYGDDTPILPLSNTVNVYRCFDEHLKHIPKKVLETIENDLLHSKWKVKI